jgi:putative membrane protein
VSMPSREEEWHRLHPLSPLVRSGRAVLAVIALLGFSNTGAFGRGDASPWYDLVATVLVALAAVVNWLVTRWKVDGVTLRIETGLLRRDSRQLPVARIQAVDMVRPFLARMLGLAELRIRLASGGDADSRLAYLTEQSAVALRARLLAAHHGLDPATPEPSERVEVTVPTGRLVAAVLLPAAVLGCVALGAAAALAWVSPAGVLAAVGPVAWWAFMCATLVWRRVSTEYGFTVAQSPDGLRIRRGLLATVAETIPVARIQAVRMVEPVLWRPLGWCRLEVDVAGGPGHDRQEGGESRRKALLAVGPLAQARRLAAIAVGDGFPVLSRPPRRAFARAPLSYHFLAAGHDGALAVTVTGRARRVTTWVPLAKTQSVRLVQGPWQRRLRLASVTVDAAGRHVHARFAERDQAEAEILVHELAALSRTARRRAAWRPGPAMVPPPGPGDGQAASVAPPVNVAQSDA